MKSVDTALQLQKSLEETEQNRITAVTDDSNVKLINPTTKNRIITPLVKALGAVHKHYKRKRDTSAQASTQTVKKKKNKTIFD